MSNEQDLVGSPRPIAEPSTKQGMSRIRFFKILTPRPAQYEAILEAYHNAPAMPVVQIPRAAVSVGDRVEATEFPINEGWKNIDRRLFRNSRGEPTLIGGVDVVSVSQLNSPSPDIGEGTDPARFSFIQPLTDTDLKKAA